MILLNHEPAARTHGADRLAVELFDAALELPDSGERLAKLTGSLHHFDPSKLGGDDTRTAFWINVYNALRLQVFRVAPPTTSVPLSLSRYRGYGWRIGPHVWSLSVIHHGLLRANRRPLWSLRPMLAKGDPRLECAPRLFDPRIHFALSTGAGDAPAPRRFVSGSLEDQLKRAERDYVAERTKVVDERILWIPPLLRAYRADFGLRGKQEAIDWILARLPDERRLFLLARREKIVAPWRLLVFDWSFRS